jgi:hypothetical protein
MRKGTNNPNGRPKGKANKVTLSLKEKINLLIEKNIDNFQKDLVSLEPKERLGFLIKLFEYAVPKQRQIEIEQEKQRESFNWSVLSKEEIMTIAELTLKAEQLIKYGGNTL